MRPPVAPGATAGRAAPVALVALGALAGAATACGDGRPDGGDAPPPVGAVTAVPSPAAGRTSTPNLTVTADGRVLLSWTERVTDSLAAIRLAALDGAAWGPVRTIATGRRFFVNWADFPSVIALGRGRLAAHWLEREGDGRYSYGVRVAWSPDGGATWSPPATPHGDGLPAEHGFVSLWALGDSAVGAAWLDGRKTAMPDSAREMTLRTGVVRFGVHGEAAAPVATAATEALLDSRICDCCQTASAPTRRGRVVVYRDRSPDEIRDIGIVREVRGAWTAPALVHADGWHMTGCPVNGPSVASLGDTVVVAWFTAAQDTARVRLARSVDGGATFGAPVRVDDGEPIGRVQVLLDDRGDALVAWMEAVGERAEIRVRRLDAAGRRSAAQVVSVTAAARASGFPRMARVGDRLLFAWTGVSDSAGVQVATAPVR